MDMVQVVVFDVGWIFFAAWSMALAAFSVVAFGRDILRGEPPTTPGKERSWVLGSSDRASKDVSPNAFHL
jgi:hypothetical protein